jgi:hypothetical protein
VTKKEKLFIFFVIHYQPISKTTKHKISVCFPEIKHMRIVLFITLLCGFSTLCTPQNYPIGHRTINYIDSARENRPIPSELYYPATDAGENTPPATGLFPVIVFGHGYLMGYDSYLYFKNAIVPEGYILVFPKTEMSLFPSHPEFGADLAFLVAQMKAEGLNPASPFFQHIDSTAAVMGHSMGGGASFLGCQYNTTPTAMITWAAAETDPSAISAARHITIPSLVFAAGLDCVAPPGSNQIPMYDSLISPCKFYVSITGGGHCYFADANFLCSLGEAGCPAFSITREQQHETVMDFTKLFLDYSLKNLSNAWISFNDSLNNSPRITFQKSCTITSAAIDQQRSMARVFPNPSRDISFIDGSCSGKEQIDIEISDVSGKKMQNIVLEPKEKQYRLTVDMQNWADGVYLAKIISLQGTRVIKIVKY